MREYPTIPMERARLLDGPYASTMKDGCNGAFVIRFRGSVLRMIVSDGTDAEAEGWEHVSVSHLRRCPTWTEMCWVKDQFWHDDEVVFQLHPKRSEYVNHHPFCLHLWRHKLRDCPTPPSIFVGPMEGGNQ